MKTIEQKADVILSDIARLKEAGVVSPKRIAIFLEIAKDGVMIPVKTYKDSYASVYATCVDMVNSSSGAYQLIRSCRVADGDVFVNGFELSTRGKSLYSSLSEETSKFFLSIQKAGFRTIADVSIFILVAAGKCSLVELIERCDQFSLNEERSAINKTIAGKKANGYTRFNAFATPLYTKYCDEAERVNAVELSGSGKELFDSAIE